jgi:hypothetical protein
MTYRSNRGLYWSVKKLAGFTALPAELCLVEVLLGDVPSNAGKNDIGLTPFVSKVIIKAVVLDIVGTGNVRLSTDQRGCSNIRNRRDTDALDVTSKMTGNSTSY